jgi:hypothetical protein
MVATTVEHAARNVASHSNLSVDDLAHSIRVKVKTGENHLRSAGVQLLEAKRRLPEFGLTFSAFICGKCGLQTSRAYELIAIAEDRTTVEDVRAKYRKRQAGFAAKNKAARSSVTNGQPASPDPRAGRIIKILCDASDSELTLWEAFANERLSQRTDKPSGALN